MATLLSQSSLKRSFRNCKLFWRLRPYLMATVLVADDDRDTRLLVRTVLEHAGHAVVEAENGSVALSVAERKRPDRKFFWTFQCRR